MLVYVLDINHVSQKKLTRETILKFVQNVNNYVIFVPHVPIYWSERINKVEVEIT